MKNGGNTSAAEVAYENTADETWARHAFDLYQRQELRVQAFDMGVVSAQVWGTCPRCGHDLNVQQTLSTPIVGFSCRTWPVDSANPARDSCGYRHPGSRRGWLRLRANASWCARAGHRLWGQLPPANGPARSTRHGSMTAEGNSAAPVPAARRATTGPGQGTPAGPGQLARRTRKHSMHWLRRRCRRFVRWQQPGVPG